MDNSTNQTAVVNSPDNQSDKWNGDTSSGSSATPATPSIDGSNIFGAAWTPLITSSTTSSLLPESSGWPSNTETSSMATPLTTTASPSIMTSSQPTSSFLPSSSAIPEPINPSVMGHVQLNASMWQQPGIIIGVACSALGFLCIVLGLVYHLHQRRNTRRPIRGLRVVSGFDFNGGGEDDYAAYNVWDKPAIGSAAADKAEKGDFEYDGPLTVMGNLRQSTATMYSNADDDEENRRTSSLPSIDEKGIAL